MLTDLHCVCKQTKRFLVFKLYLSHKIFTSFRMLWQFFNFRLLLTLLAVAIVTGTIFYTDFLSKKIQKEEREKLGLWVEANKFIASAPGGTDLTLASLIQQQNTDIPIILTNENDSILDHRNLDSSIILSPELLRKKLNEFKKENPPIELVLSTEPLIADRYYYGDSLLLKQIKYFPIIQLFVVALFIVITIYSISIRNKSTQNQVWAGMAREAAHQLGTPLTSLQGWIEILKEQKSAENISTEMEKDIERLRLISDRFGKIGSAPHLEPNNIISQIQKMIAYMKHIAPEKVEISLHTSEQNIQASISPPLFDWVIENLLKNALDAIGGKGSIDIDVKQDASHIFIDVKDSGKGISSQNLNKIFKPGFTTKKRGWGLGLSLCKRIIEQYHGGQLSVKSTEPGKGTTFHISLVKEQLLK